MKIVISIVVLFILLSLWCCLKVASDEDEAMGCD